MESVQSRGMKVLAQIAGIGLVTPLGDSAEKTWDALLAGRAIIDHERIPDIVGDDRCAQIAAMAAEAAVQNAGWSRAILADDRTALIVATSKGPIECWLAGRVGPSGLGQIANHVARDLGMVSSPCLTVSAACASGLHGLIRAAMGLACGEFDRVLVVAAEASVHPLFIGSFQRLGVLPPVGHGCRPFDRQRHGFLMSEAAAAVCLEKSGNGIAQISRYAMGGDATHLTAGDPGAGALRRVISHAIDAKPIDFIHAHGTGTVQHDPVELAAIEPALPAGAHPPVYSHKAALGHSLGAAGLVSIVLNCLIHKNGIIPPNVNTKDPLPTRLQISPGLLRQTVRRSLAIASGFGGALAAITLESVH
jgi:3-oxoacyl-[acyl-carrier-protein] synthase II